MSPNSLLIFTWVRKCDLASFTTSLKSEPSAFENAARCQNSETKLQRSDDRPMSSPSLIKLGPQNRSVKVLFYRCTFDRRSGLHSLICSCAEVCFVHSTIGATTVGTGGDWSRQLLGWGTNNVLVPQHLGRTFKKARNFSASSHQNARFSI